MEAIRRFLQLLGIIKDRRLKEIASGQYACASCSAEELQTWQDFIAYIDLLETSPEYPARKILHEIISSIAASLPEKLAFFHQLSGSRDDWSEILRFAELPIQFAHETFEYLNSEFAKARSIDEQASIIARSFNTADPTHIEMLFLLVEGNIERKPQPQTVQACALIERERAARAKLAELFSGPFNDDLRWWLIRTINSSSGPAQAFLKETVKTRNDLRLRCMLLPMLLKAGFEWAGKFAGKTCEETSSIQSHMYENRINRLINLGEAI